MSCSEIERRARTLSKKFAISNVPESSAFSAGTSKDGSMVAGAAFILNDSQNLINHRKTTTYISESASPNIEFIVLLPLPFIPVGFLAVPMVSRSLDRQKAFTLPPSCRHLRSILENNISRNELIA